MRALLVYCHPVPESFVAAVRDAVMEGLAAGGHSVDLLDLYAEGFNPVMSAEERRAYHTATLNEVPVADMLRRLKDCDALVFVYPTWWYGQPALLKGWLDRVWVPHAAFTMPSGNTPIGRVLTNIRLLAAVTTLGSPRWWWLAMGEPGRRILLRGLKPLVHPRARTLWRGLHRMDSADDTTRKAYLARIRRDFTVLQLPPA
jgi:putative NADPH-quinone reductase